MRARAVNLGAVYGALGNASAELHRAASHRGVSDRSVAVAIHIREFRDMWRVTRGPN